MIIFDERKYAKELLSKKKFETKGWQSKEIECIVKYLKSENATEEEIKNTIVKFNYRGLQYFEPFQVQEILNVVINEFKDLELITGKTITLYKSELDTILELESDKDKQLLFCILVYGKWLGVNAFNFIISDMIKLSKSKMTTTEFYSFIHNLVKKELISLKTYRRKKGNRSKVLYILNFMKEEGEVALEISNFDDVVYNLFIYQGDEDYEYCPECNSPYKKVTSRKYCLDCSKKVNLEKAKDSSKEKYTPLKTKIIKCESCHKEFEVNSKVTKKTKCDECYKEYRREKVADAVRKLRDR